MHDEVQSASTEVINIGLSQTSGKTMLHILRSFFQKGTYDIFYKNCNTFSDAALYYLTKSRLNGCYNRIERLITATNPVSTAMINKFFRAFVENSTGAACDVDIYVPNPRSEDFHIEDVIASLDEVESDTDSRDSDAESDAG